MYFPTLLSLVIFSLCRTLFFTAYLIAVLFSCSFHESQVNIRQQLFDTAVGVLSLLVVNMIAIAQKSHMAKLQRRQAEKELERRKMCSKMFTAARFFFFLFLHAFRSSELKVPLILFVLRAFSHRFSSFFIDARRF